MKWQVMVSSAMGVSGQAEQVSSSQDISHHPEEWQRH